jgi:hypothetical protein
MGRAFSLIERAGKILESYRHVLIAGIQIFVFSSYRQKYARQHNGPSYKYQRSRGPRGYLEFFFRGVSAHSNAGTSDRFLHRPQNRPHHQMFVRNQQEQDVGPTFQMEPW